MCSQWWFLVVCGLVFFLLLLFLRKNPEHLVATCQLKSVFSPPGYSYMQLVHVDVQNFLLVQSAWPQIILLEDSEGTHVPESSFLTWQWAFLKASLTIRLSSVLSFLGLTCQGMELTHFVANANRYCRYVLIVNFYISVWLWFSPNLCGLQKKKHFSSKWNMSKYERYILCFSCFLRAESPYWSQWSAHLSTFCNHSFIPFRGMMVSVRNMSY